MTKLTIPIEPKPQTRPKFSKLGTHEDPKMKAWRRSCTYLVKSLWKVEKIEGAIEVDVTFYLKAPQTISKKPTQKALPRTLKRFKKFVEEKIWHATRPDLDNYIKALFDSIGDAGTVWNDDGQVCSIHARKVYSPNPRIEIEIEEV